MKKIICALLALVMLLCCGCGAVNTAVPAAETPAAETAAPAPSQEVTAEPPAETPGVSEEQTGFVFTADDLPVIDGSTSTKPLAAAVLSVLLGIDREDALSMLSFSRTTASFRNLMNGGCDLLIVSEPSPDVFTEMQDAGFAYEIESIATEALVFVVNADNPVDSLTADQIRGIYSGEITNWSQVGGNDEEIVAFQRNEGAGSQVLMEKLVMGDTPMTEAPTGYIATEMGELMEAVRGYDNSANAIGYSVYYYANDMKKAEGLKIISVDGVEPTDETIASGDYPFLSPYYSVIPASAAEDSPARILYNWLVSEEGQAIVKAEGYVPAVSENFTEENVAVDMSHYVPSTGSVYTRISDSRIEDLTAHDDCGTVFPYAGIPMYSVYESGTYTSGYLYGIADTQGRLLTDPVYSGVELLSRYDAGSFSLVYENVWSLCKGDGEEMHDDTYGYDYIDDHSRYAFASLDGSVVSECVYTSLYGIEGGFVAVREDGACEVYDGSCALLFTISSVDGLPLAYSAIGHSSGGYVAEAVSGEDYVYYLLDDSGNVTAGPMSYTEAYGDYVYPDYIEDMDTGGWTVVGSTGVCYREAENGMIEIMSDQAENTLLIPGGENVYVSAFNTIDSEADVNYVQAVYYSEDYSDSDVLLISLDLQTVIDDSSCYYYVIRDGVTGEWYFMRIDDLTDAYTLYTADLTSLGAASSRTAIYNGIRIFADTEKCTVCARDGSLILRYQFDASATAEN